MCRVPPRPGPFPVGLAFVLTLLLLLTAQPANVTAADALPPILPPTPTAPVTTAPVLSVPDTRTRVTPTSSLPNSAVCRLFITWPDGSNQIGSGFLIGNHWLLTAAHLIYDPTTGDYADAVVAYPGEDGVTTPFGSAAMTQHLVPTSWFYYGDPNYDWALVKLNQPLGQAAGRLYFNVAPDSFFSGNPTVTALSYPTDLSALGTEQYSANGPVIGWSNQLLFDLLPRDEFDNGGPILDAGGLVVGVASYSNSGLSNNQEIRVQSELMLNLRTVIDDWFSKVDNNNAPARATDINALKGQWLSTYLGGPCVQWDEDWYTVTLPYLETHIQIRCNFTNAQGNIDLELTDAAGNAFTPIHGSRISAGAGDSEVIDCTVPAPGNYLIRVHGDNMNNAYDLVWDRYLTPAPQLPSGGSVVQLSEGGAAVNLPITLTAAPTADVTVTFTPDAQVAVAPATLTFTPANWNTPQQLALTAVDDAVAEGAHFGVVTLATTSTDPAYNTAQTWTETAQITDNDTAGVTRVQSGGTTAVTEGGATDSYTLVLTSQPTADVIITPTPDGQLSVSPATLTFTALTWNVPQTITVTAVDDAAVEGPHTGQITHAASSADAVYNNLPIAALTVSITDNDPGVLVHPAGTSGVQKVTEGRTTSFTVELSIAPTASVTVTLLPDAQLTVNPTTLTFTTANWNVPQTVQVTALDDVLKQGDRTVSVTHQATSTDANYNLVQTVLSVLIHDNESDPPAKKKSKGCEVGAADIDWLPLLLLTTLCATFVVVARRKPALR